MSNLPSETSLLHTSRPLRADNFLGVDGVYNSTDEMEIPTDERCRSQRPSVHSFRGVSPPGGASSSEGLTKDTDSIGDVIECR